MLPKGKTLAQVNSPSIEVAGVKLHLGMATAQIEEKLSGARIVKVKDDSWLIGDAENVLQFTHGLLSFAGRSWVTNENDISKAFFGSVSTLNKEGYSRCTVTADTVPDPTTTRERVYIDCGEKGIQVVRMTVNSKVHNLVMEQLGRLREEYELKAGKYLRNTEQTYRPP
jgi:hypothetical protein